MTIFIRTYRGDREWLRVSLPLLVRRAHGFREIVVVMTQADAPHFADFDLIGARVVLVENDQCPGYMAQQITKLHADQYTDDSLICFTDSDTLPLVDFTPNIWCHEGRPIQLIRDWDNVGDAKCWRTPTHTAIGHDPQFEHMACLPLIYHRDTLAETRRMIEAAHPGLTARQYIERCSEFSEFNTIGAVAHLNHRHLYEWRVADPAADGFPRILRQFWSWGGFTPEVKEEIARISQ